MDGSYLNNAFIEKRNVVIHFEMRGTDVLGTVFSQIFQAYIFVARFSVIAVKRAAFITQKFDFILLDLRECIKLIIQLIQPEIRNNIFKITPFPETSSPKSSLSMEMVLLDFLFDFLSIFMEFLLATVPM